MKSPLTEADIQRRTLMVLIKSINSAWCFKELRTFDDLYNKIGWSESIKKEKKQGELTYEDVKQFTEQLKNDLESRLRNSGSAERPKNETHNENPNITDTKLSTNPSPITKSNDEPKETKELTAKDNYGFIPSPKETGFHLWYQKKAIVEICRKVFEEKKTGILLLAAGGLGKTFIAVGVLRRALDRSYADDKTFSHVRYLYETRATILEQTRRVFENFYGIDIESDAIELTNVEAIRSRAGELWIKENTRIIEGEEEIDFEWKERVQPVLYFKDESQSAKNSGTKTTEITIAYTKLKSPHCLISISATPFTKVSEAKYFAISTRRPLEHMGFPFGSVLTEDNWPTYASRICEGSDPNEHNEAACKRLRDDLDDWIVQVKGVIPQFRGINKVEKVPFPDEETRIYYMEAWNRFVEEMAKLDKEVDEARYRFVILIKFAMAAEKCHAKDIAHRMYKAVQEGKAAVCGVKYKGTIIAINLELDKLGVKRDQISLIWGGGQTQLTKKQKAKNKIKELGAQMAEQGIDIDELMESAELDKVEDRVLLNLPKHLRLGAQEPAERQREIDNFQSGKSLYACFTFKAGGVGLSLHHSDEQTVQKCRRKESGYAVEEDIPLIPVKQRETFLAPTYSGIDMAQGLWRVPRITSLSDTIQTILLYLGTIEEDIFEILNSKMRCIGAVSRDPKSWIDVMINRSKKQEYIEDSKQMPSDEEGATGEIE